MSSVFVLSEGEGYFPGGQGKGYVQLIQAILLTRLKPNMNIMD